jgi:hypothetical protein
MAASPLANCSRFNSWRYPSNHVPANSMMWPKASCSGIGVFPVAGGGALSGQF